MPQKTFLSKPAV